MTGIVAADKTVSLDILNKLSEECKSLQLKYDMTF